MNKISTCSVTYIYTVTQYMQILIKLNGFILIYCYKTFKNYIYQFYLFQKINSYLQFLCS